MSAPAQPFPWTLAAERIDAHYCAFYFEHGRPPSAIYAPARLLLDLDLNPYAACWLSDAPPRTFNGVPLCLSTRRGSDAVYSPLP